MSARFARRLCLLLAVAATLLGCAGARGRYNPHLVLSSRGSTAAAEVPQRCGPGSEFGAVRAGSTVVLRQHRPVQGDRNWITAMSPYVGQETRVTARGGRDPSGCPVVRVAADGGRHYWRVRDLVAPGRGLGPSGGDAVPQHCGQDESSAEHGLVGPGATVVLWRHRTVEGETNWAEDMASHVGQETRVTRLAGVDGNGCPVVNVDIDNAMWIWRVRDLTLVSPSLPQTCDGASSHGPLTVGATVRLGRHRPVRGEAAWRQTMEAYVGRLARITSLGPPDDQGCPVVHVDADQGARSWRVRDLALVDEVPAGVALGGVATAAIPGSRTGIPQECGQQPGAEQYGALREGSRVVLGRHRPIDGDDNWAEEMGTYVGRTATVTRLSGSDGAGCPGVRVDIDGGEWFWRIRDVTAAP